MFIVNDDNDTKNDDCLHEKKKNNNNQQELESPQMLNIYGETGNIQPNM